MEKIQKGVHNSTSNNVKRYLGRHAVESSANKKPSKKFNGYGAEAVSHTFLQTDPAVNRPSPFRLSNSFCAEFEEDVMFAMDKLERDYAVGKQCDVETIMAESSKDEKMKGNSRVTIRDILCDNRQLDSNAGQGQIECISDLQQSTENSKCKPAVTACKTQSGIVNDIGRLDHLPKTPCGRTSSCRELADNDAGCTWATPLHISTPLYACGRTTVRVAEQDTSCLLKDAELNCAMPGSKVFCSKMKLSYEKTKMSVVDQSKNAENIGRQSVCGTNDESLDSNRQLAERKADESQNLHQNDCHGVKLMATRFSQSVDVDRLKLSSWGLPSIVLQRYEERGIVSMFEWQAECLCTGKVLVGGNLVYAAPTSAGKTMVTELLMLKCVLETKKKALFILPFVAVAREKVAYLQGLFQDAGVRVDGYFGHVSPAGGFGSVDIAICTIEKANSLLNRLLEEGKIDQLGIVVVDELHLVGDSHRGYLLELLLTKLRYVTKRMTVQSAVDESKKVTSNPVQIVGMSATLPNLNVVARWLDAELYRTDFRPIPLTEFVKVGNDIYDSSLSTRLRVMAPLASGCNSSGDNDVVPLCLETIAIGCSVLIFCPTKNWCEKLADSIAREFFRLLREVQAAGSGFVKASEAVALKLDHELLRDVVEQLKRTSVGLDALLAKMVPLGVAYHHAGLTFDERDIIEGAFRHGSIRVLVATSTLSSGVNLPARRVIIRTPMFHGSVIDTLTYKQMIGRAGRKGVDTCGESFLICKNTEKNTAKLLASSELPPVLSCLFGGGGDSLTTLSSSMKRAILEIVVSKVAKTPEEVETYAECTLLAASLACDISSADTSDRIVDKSSTIKPYISYLLDNEFITRQTIVHPDGKEEVIVAPTQLGSAVVASALSPDEGLAVFAELQKARRCFVLENELHTVYLVTPLYAQDQWGNIDWMQYLCLWEQLPADLKRVAELVGIKEGYLARAVRSGGMAPCQTAVQVRAAAVHRRFYAAMALHDLANEMPLPEVVKKYCSTRGVLQSLQQSAATFAGMVTVFCNRLGWNNLELLLAQFQSRLSFGVQRELIDLVRISLLNAQRARAFFNAGYETVASLASADPTLVERILRNSSPFLSKKKAVDEADWELAERCKTRCIWVAGEKGLTEHDAALVIVQEAKKLISDDLLQMGVDWKPPASQEATLMTEIKRPVERSKRLSHGCKQKNKSMSRTVQQKTPGSKCNGTLSLDSPSVQCKSILTPPVSMAYCRRESVENQGNRQSGEQALAVATMHVDDAVTVEIIPGVEERVSLMDTSENTEKLDTCDRKFSANEIKVTFSSEKKGLNLNGTEHVRASKPVAVSVDKNDSVVDQFSDKNGPTLSGIRRVQRGHVEDGVKTVSFSNVVVCNVSESDLDNNAANQSFNMSNSNIFSDSGILNALASPMTCALDIRGTDRVQRRTSVEGECSDEASTKLFESKVLDVGQLKLTTQLVFNPYSLVCKEMTDAFEQDCGTDSETFGIMSSRAAELQNVRGEIVNSLKSSLQPFVADKSFQRTLDLLPASAYDREQFANNPLEGLDKGFSEDVLFGEDFGCAMPNCSVEVALRTFDSESRLPAAQVISSSFICDKEMANNVFENEMNHSDLFTSFVDEHLATLDLGTVKEKNRTPAAEPSQSKQSKNEDMEDDSLIGTLLEKVLAMVRVTDTVDHGSQAIAQFSRVRQSNDVEDPSRGVVPDAIRKHANDFNTATVGKLIQSTKEKNLRPRRSQTCKKRSGDTVSMVMSRRKKMMNEEIENENKHPNVGAGSRSRRRVNVSYASTSDSSSYVPPTPPSTSKSNHGMATPKRLVGGVAGATPHKDDTSIANKRRHKKGDSILEDEFPNISSSCKKNCKFSPIGDRGSLMKVSEPVNVFCEASQTISPTSFTVIDVAASRELFENFIAEWRTKQTFSLCLACDKVLGPIQKNRSSTGCRIGAKFARGSRKSQERTPKLIEEVYGNGIPVENNPDSVLVGIAISWEGYDAYYVSLTTADTSGDLDGSLLAPSLDDSLSVADRLAAIKSVLNGAESQPVLRSVTLFDIREQYKMLSQCCGIVLTAKCLDPKVACWLLDPGSNEKNLHSMVLNYCPQDVHLLQGVSCGTGLGSIGINPMTTSSGRLRACLEAVLVNGVMACLGGKLYDADLQKSFEDVEMPSLLVLAKMELNGMGFNLAESENQKSVIQSKLAALEEHAYHLAGHPFSLTSVDDVGQVLYVELRLSPPGDTQSFVRPETRRTTARRAKPSWSTAKDVLEKLRTLHPLPAILLEWRRLTAALTKSVFPLQRIKTRCNRLLMDRIHGVVDTFTATGRVTMHEPNLQNIPKDYVIEVPADGANSCLTSVGSQRQSRKLRSSMSVAVDHDRRLATDSFSVSMRNSFVPFSGGVLVAADYSQLELRIIAHLSGDQKLIDVLNGGGDVFKMIASQWRMVGVEDVTDVQRQQAKQVCYGMIYGIGPQALGEQIGVDANEAAVFIESFKAKFTGLRAFLRDTVSACRKDGYVKTILGRRRYLPAISSLNHHAKSHAERQAVNTTVQGSAADLVKTAMVRIDAELAHKYPDTATAHRHRHAGVPLSGTSDAKRNESRRMPRGAYFILQLHDELIYEVNSADWREVCEIIKRGMESALKLSVKLPVKLKVGSSWGCMTDMVH